MPLILWTPQPPSSVCIHTHATRRPIASAHRHTSEQTCQSMYSCSAPGRKKPRMSLPRFVCVLGFGMSEASLGLPFCPRRSRDVRAFTLMEKAHSRWDARLIFVV